MTLKFVEIKCVYCGKTIGKIRDMLWNAISDLDIMCVDCKSEE